MLQTEKIVVMVSEMFFCVEIILPKNFSSLLHSCFYAKKFVIPSCREFVIYPVQ